MLSAAKAVTVPSEACTRTQGRVGSAADGAEKRLGWCQQAMQSRAEAAADVDRIERVYSPRLCDHAGCRKLLTVPGGRCARCKAAVYCSKECQTRAWKAGHKRECAPCAPAQHEPLPASTPTPEQLRLQARLDELRGAMDWRGLMALESEALVVAQDVREVDPSMASMIYTVLGDAFDGVGQHRQAIDLHHASKAIKEEMGDRAGIAYECNRLGTCYTSTGEFRQAISLHEQAIAISDELADRAEVGRACGNLGICYHKMGADARAIQLHAQDKAIAEELGDRAGVAAACGNLGVCFESIGEYERAIKFHEQDRAISEELGNRDMLAGAVGNLGICLGNKGEYAQAMTMHAQERAIAEELGDRDMLAAACVNTGICYRNTGDYARAIVLYEQGRALAVEVGNPLWELNACSGIADCYLSLGDYDKTISYFETKYELAKRLESESRQADAALGIGVALRLQVGAVLQGRAAGTPELPGPHPLASARVDDRVREAEKWLQTALDGGHTAARLHLARLVFDAGPEDTALAHLQDYLSWCVARGRNRCAGCYQTRGEDAQMLTCGGCRVARFCSADHQKMASKSIASGGCFLEGRHKDVCGVLGKWRQQVVKDGMSPDVLRADLLAFLRQ